MHRRSQHKSHRKAFFTAWPKGEADGGCQRRCTSSACASSRRRVFWAWRLRRAAKWAGVRPSAAEAVNQAAALHLHALSSFSAKLSSGAMAARCRGVNPEASFTSACKHTVHTQFKNMGQLIVDCSEQSARYTWADTSQTSEYA